STENWTRPPREVRLLMRILEMVIDRELEELNQQGVQIRHIGALSGVEPHLQRKLMQACQATQHNDRLILNVAFNYGGRDEIVRAVRRIISDGVAPDAVTEQLISNYLDTGGLPDPDLIIRTSGELRVSNFLIWQGSYSEYYPTATYWPDFDKAAYHEALLDYGNRHRRLGRTDAQLKQSDESDEGDDFADED
ncbi:MAG: di-trans,poly-cis-decaprenylcistransferase, partial [Armatimonadetes bacterium]|nr:di-trans,poly-cis-decaprenylcistransferase [Anaerolineae bacterium]